MIALHLLANLAVIALAIGCCRFVLARVQYECITEFKSEPALWAEIAVVGVHVAVVVGIVWVDWL